MGITMTEVYSDFSVCLHIIDQGERGVRGVQGVKGVQRVKGVARGSARAGPRGVTTGARGAKAVARV